MNVGEGFSRVEKVSIQEVLYQFFYTFFTQIPTQFMYEHVTRVCGINNRHN